LLFTTSCCKITDKSNLRVGLKEIYNIYETWCKINCKKCLKTQKKFKEEFEKINYKEEKSKGVDINNNPGKRGYNITVSL
jgi:phage/plasmid-associated DNA primase